VDVTINEKKIKLAGEFKYPRFTGTEDYPWNSQLKSV
jgi:hypothetical protein